MNIFNLLLIQPLTNGLIFFYRLLGENMGLAIIAFSIFLRFLLNPLTKPYMESMKRMKDLGPQLEKLKAKHKDDKQKLMKAQADFYKEKGINPSAGCLPYLLQIVILIALFNVFIKVLAQNGDTISKLNEVLYQPLRISQNQVINTKFLYLDITKPDVFNLPNIPFPLPGPILILAALVQFASAKIMAPFVKEEEKLAKKTKGKEDDLAVAMQNSSTYTFPLFTIIFGIGFASGLALYWLIFSLYQAIQQYQTSGWGGLTPLIKRIGLIKSKSQ
ncbi:hypothetical protein A3D00_03115 [Candidatus Woesebacteria bacterium RIFCSPHIGHO2_02_FULL_38_9]|uniref:Membrane insertase YidC/Oxa/ALB C-terminal domain-containing protein n=1 Tax=Candidatus Woesebacteria bacterium RIFCSPHIGHO2_01_FULL_39_28 TaxID=1802496 RepID=A0A1F7YL75_9BACT|nr:MAG: hypothetical protein A2627_00550 [Candidatus Woesebacteria bacterium RIFCSPHIGHO2_01_FULL_39_28]OGM33035.1 MAG: hypothetical protein A3D00_03115 [Candidatus Woesebacteria bacterium RIFCSPHIGHO2_02_FULL_38_9]OGM56699.1 MAG: hypothetical protein A3A50_05070 [Candidatus Woesebacteria bacterium RIFCSPLOWO2_01_FULL_38_20]